MGKKDDLQTLVSLNDSLKENKQIVEQAKIKNPSKEVEESLVSFLTKRLDKISEDNDFETIIKNNIRQRLPEASFEELIHLLHNVQTDNNLAVEGIRPMFVSENSDKNVIDNLKEDSGQTAAANLYKSTDDKTILQAVTYLGQVMSEMKKPIDVVEINPDEDPS